MKTLLMFILVCTSLSTFAQARLDSSLGYSELAGTTAVLEFDWHTFIRKISGQERAERRKSDRAFCLNEYKKIAVNYADIQEKMDSGVFSADQVPHVLSISANSEKAVDLTCEKLLGKRKAKNLKAEIINL